MTTPRSILSALSPRPAPAKPAPTFEQLVDQQMQLARQNAASAAAEFRKPPMLQSGGWLPLPALDLSATALQATATGVQISVPGRALVYEQVGSTPGALINVDFGGGIVRTMMPGQTVKGPFDTFTLRLNAQSVAAGTASFVVVQGEGVELIQAPTPLPSGSYKRNVVGPNGAATQASASAANTPVAATDGVSLAGVVGFRCSVWATVMGTNITAVTNGLRLWRYEANAAPAAWLKTSTIYVPETGARGWSGPDEIVQVQSGGQLYAEADTITGVGGLTVQIERWGSGLS